MKMVKFRSILYLAGLDYPGIGPEHSYFNAIDHATHVSNR